MDMLHYIICLLSCDDTHKCGSVLTSIWSVPHDPSPYVQLLFKHKMLTLEKMLFFFNDHSSKAIDPGQNLWAAELVIC